MTHGEAGAHYARINDPQSACATRPSAGRVAGERETRLLLRGDTQDIREYVRDETADESGGPAQAQPASRW